jgi:hypothetical protein
MWTLGSNEEAQTSPGANPIWKKKKKNYYQKTVSDNIISEDKFIQSFRITFKGITVGKLFLCKLDWKFYNRWAKN